jgi:Outer membrane protein beta-barrel domain
MRILVPVLLVFLFVTPAFAQEAPAWEFFGGYSLERANVREYYKATPSIYAIQNRYENFNGWEFAVTENANSWFGGTADVSGHYKTSSFRGSPNQEYMHSFLYGPAFSWRKPLFVAFAHVLLGATLAKVQVTPVGPHDSDTSFTVAGGGGVDLNLGNKIAVRLFQVEYLRANALGSNQNNYRAAAGVVFHTGPK